MRPRLSRLSAAACALFLLASGALASLEAQEVVARFYLPSGAMLPTLQPHAVVSAVRYTGSPSAGDVVAFRKGGDSKTVFIMRVVAVPGQTAQLVADRLMIDGRPVNCEKLGATEVGVGEGTAPGERWRETLPNGVSYETMTLVRPGPLADTEVFKVPPGRVFVLGDNRDNAQDSRLIEVGFVGLDEIVGKIVP